MSILSLRRRACAAVCLAVFLALQLFASSGSLHKLIHPDGDSPDHHCAITLLGQGQVNAPEALPVLVAFVAALLFLLPLIESAVLSSFNYRFSSSRAPPF